MASQFGGKGNMSSNAHKLSVVEQCISLVDSKLKPAYRRCTECKVPMHKDGHEEPKWCNESKCPTTRVRFQPSVFTASREERELNV